MQFKLITTQNAAMGVSDGIKHLYLRFPRPKSLAIRLLERRNPQTLAEAYLLVESLPWGQNQSFLRQVLTTTMAILLAVSLFAGLYHALNFVTGRDTPPTDYRQSPEVKPLKA